MCDLGHHAHHAAFGYLVDTPEIRALIDETRRLTAAMPDTGTRVEALKPAFAALLAADGWLPEAYASPDLKSGMGSGIGQYALYRAEDGSLTLSRWSSRRAPRRPCTITWPGAYSACIAGGSSRRCIAGWTTAPTTPGPISR